jgi:hypothetical protein
MRHTSIILTAAMFLAAALSAKTHDGSSEPCVQVVGHLSLEGVQANHLFVRQSARGKRYLYAVPVEGRNVMVVDISDSGHPAISGRVSYDGLGSTGDVSPVGQNAAIVEIADHPAAVRTDGPPLRNIGVLDLSDPANPKIACHFSGVSGYLVDEPKSLIYIVNGEGLWIVRHHEPPDASVKAWEEFAAAP